MARLSAAQRKNLPSSTFAGPGRSYPIPDKAHAKAAKSLAARAYHEGRLTHAQYDKIIAAANRKLGQ